VRNKSNSTNPDPFTPIFVTKIVSRAAPAEILIIPPEPAGNLPMLERWDAHEIFGRIDLFA
jgi:hypothetical protein